MTQRAAKKKKQPVGYRFDVSIVELLEHLSEESGNSMTEILQAGVVRQGLIQQRDPEIKALVMACPSKYRQ